MSNTGRNFGKILNFKREEGINDAAKGGLRKWTGLPSTERPKKAT